jgi:tetratricopeptide (TPR) repeat protein
VIGWVVRLRDPFLWLGCFAAVAWAVSLGISMRKRAGFAVFCLLSLACSYGLVANVLVLIGTNMSERLMYLPSAFFLMFLATLLVRLPRKALIGVMVVAVGLGSLRSFTYAKRWNDRLSFYVQSLAEQPKSTQLYLLAGMEYDERHQLDAAEAVFARGCKMIPDSWRMWVERATVAIDRNRPDEAREYLHRSFELNVPPDEYFAVQERLNQLQASATTKPAHRQR